MKILENNNRKFIRVLSGNCLKANKGRNKIAVLAVTLTAVLFMALTTVYEGAQISMKTQLLRQSGTKFMVSVKNLTKEEAERLASDPAFSVAGIERYAANVVNPELTNVDVAAGWVDEASAENSFMNLEKGHYPQNDDEIACDSEILGLLGLPCDTGSTFTLRYEAGNHVLEKQMTVCGFWEGMKYEQRASVLVSEAFVEEALEQYDGEYAAMKETSYDVRGSFPDEKNIAGKLDLLVENLGYDPDAERGEEGFLIHHINPAYEVKTRDSAGAMAMAGLAVLLILAAGYLIIFNIFKISVEKDIRLYGQLKTVGASPRQLRYMVIRQGMVLSAAGIPAGLLLGCLLGNAFLPLIMANSTWSDGTPFIIPPVWVWLLSGLFTLLTVRISCSRPGRIAGKISPVEALKYHGAEPVLRNRKNGKESRNRLLSMAYANLMRSRGKTVLVVLSISMSAVLLNCVLNYTGSMDQETYVRRDTVTDFNVSSADFQKHVTEDYLKVIGKGSVETLEAMDSVADFGKVYCYMVPEEENPDHYADMGKITRVNQKTISENTEGISPYSMLYGFDENALAQTKVIEGSIDYEKLCTGNYVIMNGFLSDSGEYLYEVQEFHAGDVIEAEIGGTVREYTVMAVVGVAAAMDMSYSKGGYEAITFAEPVFLKMFPDMQDPIHCVFNAEEGKFDAVNRQVGMLSEQCGLSVTTRLTAEEEFQEMKRTYGMVGLAVSGILGMIGLLNLVNVIMTGAIARQREFASMRSIGMTKKQLRTLMVYEGILYAALAGIIGILLGALLSAVLVRNLTEGLWFMKYHFTVLPAAVVSVVCILLAAGISAMTDKVWNKGSIVEQLRECE